MVRRARNRKKIYDEDFGGNDDGWASASSLSVRGGERGRGGRGRGRGTGRSSGTGRGGGRAGGSPRADMLTTFTIPPPSPRPAPSHGRSGRRRNRNRTGGGDTRAPRGARGGGGRGSAASSTGINLFEDDLVLVDRTYATQSLPQPLQYNSTDSGSKSLYPSMRGPGRGGGREASARGQRPSTLDDPTTQRRPSRTLGIGISPKSGRGGRGNTSYRPVDANGPLSSLLDHERPLLKPIKFVPSVYSRVLFLEEEVGANSANITLDLDMQDRKDEAEVEAQMLVVDLDNGIGGGANLEFAAHAPTADRVLRVFSGELAPPTPLSFSSSAEDSDDSDGDTVEEIDFNDMGKLMASLDTNRTGVQQLPRKQTKRGTLGGVTFGSMSALEERFNGIYPPRKPEAGKAVRVDVDVARRVVEEEVTPTERNVVALEHMRVDGGTPAPAALSAEGGGTTPTLASSHNISATASSRNAYLGQASVNASPSQAAVASEVFVESNEEKVVEEELEFIIDTEPSPQHTEELETIAKPRIPTPLTNIASDEDEDEDEIIVYVAPHPRRTSEHQHVAPPAPVQDEKPTSDKGVYTPYTGINGLVRSESRAASVATPSVSGTPVVPAKRLAVPPLSTPRMAKAVMAKQRKLARREKEGEGRRGKGKGNGLFGFGGYGAMMQEKELRDEFGSGRDARWRERRRGDSDLEWGDEDGEERGGVGVDEEEEEYMAFSDLQKVLLEQAQGANGVVDKGKGKERAEEVEDEENSEEEEEDGRGTFTPSKVSSSAKRRQRRKRLLQFTNTNVVPKQGYQTRRSQNRAAAMDMDVDSELEMDVDAMRTFAAGLLGPGAGAHVTLADLEDERRMLEEDADLDGAVTDEDEESESDDDFKVVVEQEEEDMLPEDGAPDDQDEDEDDDDDDDDEHSDEDDDEEEEHTPRTSFAARLERVRDHSRNQKARRLDDDDEMYSDEDLDEYLARMEEADEDKEAELVAMVENMLDDNDDILEGRDRKAKKKLFKAISNGDFDYLEDDFGFLPAKRGQAKRAGFPPELQAQWDRDRQAKALRKEQREFDKLLQASDPFSPNKGGKKGRKATLAAARMTDPGIISVLPNRIVDISTLVQMLHKFVNDLGGRETLSLPPTDKATRKKVHELAIAFGLKSVSKGKGNARYVSVVKTTRCGPGRTDERKVEKIVRRSGGAGSRGNDFTSGSNPYRGGGAGGRNPVPKHKEGDVVGKAAPRIDNTNVGFRMLAMMGWREGERIGNEGLHVPLAAVIKHSKLGLGAS